MKLIKKTMLRVFLWSWTITLPITLIGSYLTYRAGSHYETFAVHYNPSPAALTLSGNFNYEIRSLGLKIQAAIRRATTNWTQLEAIYLYAPQADLAALDINLPHSGFHYIKAGLMLNNDLIKAKIRYRGDSIPHWGREKKSLRVKTAKNNLYQGLRHFNLLNPKFFEQLNNYLAYRLADQLGLISPHTQLVRVFMNNEDQGVHVLVEQLKEIMIRHHQLMPADVYRGEMIIKNEFTDSGISTLFESASVWDKVAVNNHYPKESTKPLAYLLELIQDQDNPEAQAELSRILDLSAWAKFSIFEALAQTQHYDSIHNWRLYYDPWRQKFSPIVWDPVGWRWLPQTGAQSEINITPLHHALFKNGHFLRLRYQLMHDFFSSKEADKFLDFVTETQKIMDLEVQSDAILNIPNVPAVRHAMKTLKKSIYRVFNTLKTEALAVNKPVLYHYQTEQLQLYLQDPRPLQRIRLDFNQPLTKLPQTRLHYQNQGQLMSQELTDGLKKSGYQLEITTDLLPNFSLHSQQFNFFNQQDTPLIGYYRLQLLGINLNSALLTVWVDYGQGWKQAQLVTEQEIISRDVDDMEKAYGILPNEDIMQKKWQLFWHSGNSFTTDNSQLIIDGWDKTGQWKKQIQLPHSVTMLRVDVPENVSLRLSQLNLRINGKNHQVSKDTLSFHHLELQGASVITQGLTDPYFVIHMPPYLPSSYKKGLMTVDISFKAETISWKDSFQGHSKTVHPDVYAPVAKQTPSNPLVWSGDVMIEGVKTILRPLIIKAGSRILLAENATLIIKNRLLAMGTKEQPIQFLPQKQSQAPWGAVVLFGSAANESVLNHCQFAEGSGLKGDLFEYTAMLSIHDVQGVQVSDCEFRDNQRVDDMVHVVYSTVRFERNQFKRAFSDALDIDISQAVIIDSVFNNSGNDAIDLMTTQAVVVNSTLLNNGDKGISVGENSQLFAVNNQLSGNAIAIQAKDASTAVLFNQTLNNNQTALHAYKKNWRYGSGGTIVAAKSRFMDNQQDVEAKKKSKIYLFDNYIASKLPKKRVHAWVIDNQYKQHAQVKGLPEQFKQLSAVQKVLQQIEPEWLANVNNQQRGATGVND